MTNEAKCYVVPIWTIHAHVIDNVQEDIVIDALTRPRNPADEVLTELRRAIVVDPDDETIN